MIYLDTSAFLKLYILEGGSLEVQALVTAQDSPLPVWDLLEAEFANALRLKAIWREVTPAQADAQIREHCFGDDRAGDDKRSRDNNRPE